jgi:alpha-tubulin suppressor-like RCC1 family protein
MQIPFEGNRYFISIQCGSTFAVALNKYGEVYYWGRMPLSSETVS